jgi:hypothetical protein
MTERKALLLICLSGLLFEAIAVIGLVAIGVRGPVLSLGLIVPLAVTCYLTSGVTMRSNASGRRRR